MKRNIKQMNQLLLLSRWHLKVLTTVGNYLPPQTGILPGAPPPPPPPSDILISKFYLYFKVVFFE